MTLRAALLTLAVVVTGCKGTVIDGPRTTVPLSVQLRFKGSCGAFEPGKYDTGCLAALFVVVRSEAGQVLQFDCVSLDPADRPPTLGQLTDNPPLISLGHLSTNRKVTFAVRGLHDVDLHLAEGETLCEEQANPDHWLFWGESKLVNLAAFDGDDAGVAIIDVLTECRDCAFGCPADAGTCLGCQGIGADATCPTRFPTSFCVPADSAHTCEKICANDNECFEGSLKCIIEDRHCDPEGGTPAGGVGGLCATCGVTDAGTLDGCNAGYTCVGNGNGDATKGFCAESCPEATCKAGMKCNRIGNNLRFITP